MKLKVVMPPPGSFGPADIYCRKRWQRVQHITDEFWTRWRKEFLHTLQERKSSNRRRRNFKNGDIVLLKNESNRNHWPIACIIETFADKHGVVRTVPLRLGNMIEDQSKLVRPI